MKNCITMIRKLVRDFIFRLRGEVTTEELINRGLIVGDNFKRLNHVIIDDSHSWLIEIGDNVTLAPNVHILAHDASTHAFLGFTKIGRVTIGNNVFIGAGSIILPGVTIGNNVIIGANSTVTHDIPNRVVVAGSPVRVLSTLDQYLEKEKARMKISPVYDESYTMRKNITLEKKREQKEALIDKSGFVR